MYINKIVKIDRLQCTGNVYNMSSGDTLRTLFQA
jgi:hypothetical protein